MNVDPPESGMMDLQLHETNFMNTQYVQISECTEICFVLCCNAELIVRYIYIFFFAKNLVIFT
jgi:hypothetical protein